MEVFAELSVVLEKRCIPHVMVMKVACYTGSRFRDFGVGGSGQFEAVSEVVG